MAVKRKNNTLPLDAPPGAVDAYANARILEKRSLSTDGEVRAELKKLGVHVTTVVDEGRDAHGRAVVARVSTGGAGDMGRAASYAVARREGGLSQCAGVTGASLYANSAHLGLVRAPVADGPGTGKGEGGNPHVSRLAVAWEAEGRDEFSRAKKTFAKTVNKIVGKGQHVRRLQDAGVSVARVDSSQECDRDAACRSLIGASEKAPALPVVLFVTPDITAQ
ncbi:hypothetical protein RI054_18g84300 [Pseudoscourfieldia marina]